MIEPPGAGSILVIGYGNELGADDGAGRAVAERLAADDRLAGCRIESVRQLTPDLALDVAEATFVVFVDATIDRPAGEIAVGPPAGEAAASPFSHHVRPGALLALAASLYGAAPEAVVVGIGASTLELGEPPSQAVRAAIPVAVDTVARLVAARLPAGPRP